MIVYIYLLIFCCLNISLQAEMITLDAPPSLERITQLIPQPITVDAATFDSDVLFSQEEFFDLTQLRAGATVDAVQIQQGLLHLFHKNKFHEIALDLKEGENGHASLHYIFTGLWTFQQLKITGIWVGKDWYRQYYLMESGDPFDETKHAHSMQKIKDSCKKNGFFNIQTESTLSRDDATKSVVVNAKVIHGNRFTIKNATLHLVADESVAPQELQQLEKLICKKYIRPLRNRKYAQEQLQEYARALKKFLAHQGFLNVSIELTEEVVSADHVINVTWHVDVHKKRTFIFFGNHFFTNTQLMDCLLQFGRSAWMLPASMLAEELMSIYHKKGFWQAIIDTREERDRSFFVIKEGGRMMVGNVQLRGVHSFSETMLTRICFSKLKGFYFDQKVLEQSLDLLMGYYVRHGFLQCKLVGHEFVPLKGQANQSLVITIDEGMPTIISNLTIPGFEPFQNQGPFVSFAKKKVQPFDTDTIQEHKKWLLKELHKTGHLYATVKPELIPNPEGTSTLCWHIFPGQKITFGKTIVHGSSSLPYDYIMRELAYTQGQLWDQDLVRQSFLRLKQLRIFDSVSFIPLASDHGNERAVLVKIHEDDPFELRIRAGLEFQHIEQYQTFGGLAYKVGGTFMVKNPTNHADQFQFDYDVARSHREVTLKYWYPWIFGWPFNGLMQGYSIKYEQPGFIGSKINIYTVFQNGCLLGLRRKLSWIDFGVNLGFEVSRTDISDDDAGTQECAQMLACAIDFDPRLLNKRIPFVFFEPTLMLDFLDNNLNPHRGTFSVLSLKGMFPTNEMFHESFFIKLLFEHSSFVSLADAVTFALRIRFGHIFHRAFCDIVPNERFYLGGANSIRSYQADHCPPLGCFVDCEGKSTLVPRGGKTMVNLNAEARIATFKNIDLVLFQDFGLLSGDNFNDFNVNNLAAGTGFGVRYFTPIGPLRFDIAWKWKKHAPNEPRTNWFLTFGQAF
jgi:translocation and assembly module TamA